MKLNNNFLRVLCILLLVIWLAPPAVSLAVQYDRPLIVRGDAGYYPFEFKDDFGDPAGFDVELLRAVAKVMGLELSINLGPWSLVRSQLEQGEIDIVAGMYYSQSRAEKVLFSKPFIHVTYAVFTRKDSPISDMADIRGKSVLVQKGGYGDDYLSREGNSYKLTRVENPSVALRLLASGKHDCALLPRLPGLLLIHKMDLDNLEAVGKPVLSRDYCFAVAKGDKKLAAILNEGLSIIRNTGEYQKIYRKWFGKVDASDDAAVFLKKLAWVMGPLLIILILVLVWTWSLRHQVASKTEELLKELNERRRAETRLKESEEKYRLLVENAAEAIFIFQEEKVRFANPTLLSLLAVSESDLYERCIYDFIAAEDTEPIKKKVAEFNNGADELKNLTLRIQNNQGVRFWLDLNFAPITWQGAPAVLCLGRDITEQKSMEAQLRQSQKMEAIGTLAGGISHDFNNILGAILGYSELALIEDNRGGDSRPLIEEVVKATQKATKLVKQILTFSRRMTGEMLSLDINSQISHAVSLLERTIPKMISIKLDLDPDLHPILGDEVQLEQVFLNLGGNAKDAMPDGGELTFKTVNLLLRESNQGLGLDAGQYVMISLSDTGTGIDPDVLPNIFDPFFTTKEVGKGTGLGLSSVFGIVKGHGGAVSCRSEKGLGTTFDIMLPAAQSVQDSLPEEDEPADDASPGRGTILFVDDEKPLRQIGRSMLESGGYQVLTASSGEKAIDAYKSFGRDIDLIVLDVGMPGMGGHQCLKELRGLNPNLKVIIVSGYAMDGLLKRTLDLGVSVYLSKPYNHKLLLSKVREVLNKS